MTRIILLSVSAAIVLAAILAAYRFIVGPYLDALDAGDPLAVCAACALMLFAFLYTVAGEK